MAEALARFRFGFAPRLHDETLCGLPEHQFISRTISTASHKSPAGFFDPPRYPDIEMSTTRQITANRLNAARSRGPITPAGKEASARNSLRHGLLSSTVVLNGESAAGFVELLQNLNDEFQPATPAETAAVETMAIARWRQLRVWSLQKLTLDMEMSRQGAPGSPPVLRAALAVRRLSADDSTLDNLHRYETAYDRQFARALRQFHFVRSTRGESDLPFAQSSLAAAGTWETTETAPCPEMRRFPDEANPKNEHLEENAQ